MNRMEARNQAIESFLKGPEVVRLPAQIIDREAEKIMLGYKTDNDYTDTSMLRRENEILRNLIQFSGHSDYCDAKLYKGGSCTCGFSEALNQWLKR